MKELKIEAGKYCRTRSGHKVRIYATDEHAPKNYQGDWKDSLFEIK